MKEQELKPCPFCQSLTLRSGTMDGFGYVNCGLCGGNMKARTAVPPMTLSEAARCRWNKRAADSVSRTKPSESASVIPQSQTEKWSGLWKRVDRAEFRRRDAEGGVVVKLSDPFDNNAWVYFIHVPPSPVSDLESEWTLEKIDQNVYFRRPGHPAFVFDYIYFQRLRAIAIDRNNGVKQLCSSLLQHESVIEKMREAFADMFDAVQQYHNDGYWPSASLSILPAATHALAIKPSPSHLDAWFQEKVKPLVEALEKIVADQQDVSPGAWTNTESIARAALGKPEPEKKS